MNSSSTASSTIQSTTQDSSGESKNEKKTILKENKEEKKSEKFLQHDPDELIIPKGMVKNIISNTAPLRSILSLEEKEEIKQAKKELLTFFNDLKTKRTLYIKMLEAHKNNMQAIVEIQTVSAKTPRRVTLPDVKKMCEGSQASCNEYIVFLAKKASILLNAGHCEAARKEFEFLLGYSKNVNGSDHFETLKIQLDYCIAQQSATTFEFNEQLLITTVNKLKKEKSKYEKEKLTKAPNYKTLQESIAIGCYALAQYYLRKKNIELANKFVQESEQLRKDYGASEFELDKINFIRGMIEYDKKNKVEASQLLEKCYIFRRNQEELNRHLIPVLDTLIKISHEDKDLAKEFDLLTHKLNIQKHLGIDEKAIVTTQAEILKAMRNKMSLDESLTLMNDIQARAEKIAITRENVEVGLCYLTLADTRMSLFLPSEWSNVKKRKYYSETSKIIYKAKSHLNMALNKDVMAEHIKYLESLREKCQTLVETHEDMKPVFVDEKLHPEDKKELALTSKNDDNPSESSTQKHLKTLSEFSSEVSHSLVDEKDRLLTVEEYMRLPNEGIINPYRLRIAQGGLSLEFQDGRKVEDTINSLKTDPDYTKNILPVEIGVHNDRVYCFDTRRLYAHLKAKETNPKVYIRYKKIAGAYLRERIDKIYSPRAWNGSVTAVRHEGKNSSSEPFIIPPLRPQLEESVQKEFKYYPADRQLADSNGFPNSKMKAKKIYKFFEERAKKGSETANEVLKHAHKLSKSGGDNALYDYLIKKKTELLSQKVPKQVLPSAIGAGDSKATVSLKIKDENIKSTVEGDIKQTSKLPADSTSLAGSSHVFFSGTNSTADSLNKKITSVAHEYEYIDEGLMPGWQRKDLKIGRHKL